MTLYEINEQMLNILGLMDLEMESDGEISVDLEKALNDLKQTREEKLEAIGCYIKNLEAECKALKEEENALKARRGAKEKKIERLEEYIKNDLIMHGEKKKEFTKVSYSFRKSTQVSITDEDAIPKIYKEECIEWNPVKAEIKRALQLGEDVPGAELVDYQNLQIK